jgi:hypothetical protein
MSKNLSAMGDVSPGVKYALDLIKGGKYMEDAIDKAVDHFGYDKDEQDLLRDAVEEGARKLYRVRGGGSKLSRLCDVELARVGLAHGEPQFHVWVKYKDGKKEIVDSSDDQREAQRVASSIMRGLGDEYDEREIWVEDSDTGKVIVKHSLSALSSLCDRELARVGLAVESRAVVEETPQSGGFKVTVYTGSATKTYHAQKLPDIDAWLTKHFPDAKVETKY